LRCNFSSRQRPVMGGKPPKPPSGASVKRGWRFGELGLLCGAESSLHRDHQRVVPGPAVAFRRTWLPCSAESSLHWGKPGGGHALNNCITRAASTHVPPCGVPKCHPEAIPSRFPTKRRVDSWVALPCFGQTRHATEGQDPCRCPARSLKNRRAAGNLNEEFQDNRNGGPDKGCGEFVAGFGAGK
jgi:hypothetical protein